MSNRRNTPLPSEAAARHLAEKGEGAIAEVAAIAERARELLASGLVNPAADGHDPHRPPYSWELTERDVHAPKRIWLGYVDDYATGEGLSVYFFAALARGEDEFRRSISLELGRELADKAEVRLGVGGFPFASMFLSPSFASSLEGFDRGEDRPAAMSFIAKYRANYS